MIKTSLVLILKIQEKLYGIHHQLYYKITIYATQNYTLVYSCTQTLF